MLVDHNTYLAGFNDRRMYLPPTPYLHADYESYNAGYRSGGQVLIGQRVRVILGDDTATLGMVGVVAAIEDVDDYPVRVVFEDGSGQKYRDFEVEPA